MHVSIQTLKPRPDVCQAVLDAITTHIPSDIVVVVDEFLINTRISSNQPYVNHEAVYVFLQHEGKNLDAEGETAVGIEVTHQFSGYEVIVIDGEGRWFASGERLK